MTHLSGHTEADQRRSRRTGQSLFTLLPAALYPLRIVIGFLGLIAKRPVRYDL
jgi:hypothetical protein